MSDSGRVAKNDNEAGRAGFGAILVICGLVLAGCGGSPATDPLVEYSTEVNVSGARPHSITRQLRDGTYLVEVRERDIDLRVRLDGAGERRELADAYQRHGIHRTVVRLERPGPLRVMLESTDQRTWRGAAAVRILRWPPPADTAPPDRRFLGFAALGRANELVARDDPAAWREALEPLREAATHFETANDLQTLAETEYQAGWLQHALLQDFDGARRSAESAQAHFDAAGDEMGVHRAAHLRALTEFEVAASSGPEVRRSEQRALLDGAVARLERARRFFAREGAHTDEIAAYADTALRSMVLGDYDGSARIHEQALRRAAMRNDRLHESAYRRGLGIVTAHRGEIAKAVAIFETALVHLERDRSPVLYATTISDLGNALIALGAFDRAQVLHTEALDVFSDRGDERRAAKEHLALAAIQFRSGNVVHALASAENAMPRFWRTRDFQGLTSALRLAGNAASELGRHEVALDYLRRAEFNDRNALSLEHTRVLIAGELRETGDFRNAERTLARLVTAGNDGIRAAALAERARLRQGQGRHAEAVADLRVADAIYARLGLDFNRIDTSTALAMALLSAGDVTGAGAAADRAIAIETRIRVSSANPELRARFLEASYAPYEARIETYLAGSSAHDPAAIWKSFSVAESLRARSLTDRLLHGPRRAGKPRDDKADHLRAKLTGLQMDLERQLHRGSLHDDEIAATRREMDETRARLEARLVSHRGLRASSQLRLPDSREAVQAMLPHDSAVLAYFVGDTRSHGWLLTRGELRHTTLPGRSDLECLVDDLVAWQRAGAKGTPPAAAASVLGDLLDGVNAKRLLVLPDGPLNGLPFAALPLPDGGERELLIDRFVIGAAPSLAIALRPASLPDGERLRVAVISDPVYTPDDRRLALATAPLPNYRGAPSGGDLARLAYSAIEARAVARAFQGADVIELAGFNATARRVIELPSEGLDVLHFATHALAREDLPGQSALFLSEYAADGSPLASDRLTADDITRSGLRADLVVLSGCATGDGRLLRGEGVLGLTHGFLGNGSHTVVSSLWPVEDAMTARFMEEFYSAYRASGRAAEALRVAQLRSRGSDGAGVWASFVIRAGELP